MITLRSLLLALVVTSAAVAAPSPCPFGKLFEDGKLSNEDAARFLAARSEGSGAVERMMAEHENSKRELKRQEKFYTESQKHGTLPLGGGLLNGTLQPFTGALALVAVPSPQPTGLKEIPGDGGVFPFQWPKTTDVRGMCPTLNTMANHGFISRNGITTFAEAANACQITLGFGYDTCTFLSALGLLAGGDLATGIYSIGGADKRVPNTLGPALGISHHGPFEVDQSISRQDTYFGNNANFQLARCNRIVNITQSYNKQFGMSMWNAERQVTYSESRSTTPNFDAGAKHLAVTLAEHVFIFRALPNGKQPTIANFANVAPFFLNETFPREWFRRPTAYTLLNVADDIVALCAMGPTELGMNYGLNNFIPLGMDFGALDASEVMCFLAINMLDFLPGQSSTGIIDEWGVVSGFILGSIAPFFPGCTFNYTQPGSSAGTTKKGSSATSPILVNGVYLAKAPKYSQFP